MNSRRHLGDALWAKSHATKNHAWALVLLAISLWLGPWSCFFESRDDSPDSPHVEGPSTETGNPSLMGLVRDEAGLPQAGVAVVLYSLTIQAVTVQDTPSTEGWPYPVKVGMAHSSTDGSYRFDSLPPGVYALESRDSVRQMVAFAPALPLASVTSRRRDTLVLRPVSRITGMARRAPGTLPPGINGHENILVRLIGTPLATYTDSSGSYALEGVPAGMFSMGLAAADGHYLPARLDSLHVLPGAAVRAPDVVLPWSPFLGEPPAPFGLQIAIDSMAGRVHLSWHTATVSNFSHYLIMRLGDAGSIERLHTTTDSTWTDSVIPGSPIIGPRWSGYYRMASVDSLGNASLWVNFDTKATGAFLPHSPQKPQRDDSVPPRLGEIRATIPSSHSANATRIKLYLTDEEPGPADSLPKHATLLDSLVLETAGEVTFASLPILKQYSYTLVAENALGHVAALTGLQPRARNLRDSLGTDTAHALVPKPAALVSGRFTRQQLWCSTSSKQNENIEVSLAGTPWWTATDFNGSFVLGGIAEGSYRLVVQALPAGCFLPDTVAVVLKSADTLTLAETAVRPDSTFIPRITGLRMVSITNDTVTLAWQPVSPAFEANPRYEVWRSLNGGEYVAVSPLLTEAPWSESLVHLPRGTVLHYAVRVVAKNGKRGALAGSDTGRPVTVTLPGP